MKIISEYADDMEIGGGKHRFTATLHPRYYLDGQQFQKITNHVETLTDTHGVNEKLVVRFRKVLKNKAIVVRHRTTYVSLTPVNANQVTGVKTDVGIIYPNAWAGVDLEFVVANQLVIKQAYLLAGHPHTIAFDVDAKSSDFDITKLSGDDLVIRHPFLEKSGEESIPLTWEVSGDRISITIPPGDWSGWMLDPTFSVQPDASSGKDTYIYAAQPLRNYGITNNFSQSVGASATVILISFNASSIPSGAIPSSASLEMYAFSAGADRVWIETVKSVAIGNGDWVEGTKNNATAGADEPCWNAKAADGVGGVTTSWAGSAGAQTSGTDYEATTLGTFSGNRSDVLGTKYTCSLLTTRIQGWFGAVNTNYGLWMMCNTNTNGLCSSDYATAAYRPLFTCDYTVSSGTMRGIITGGMIGAFRGIQTGGKLLLSLIKSLFRSRAWA